MSASKPRTALLSVYDKSGIIPLCQKLIRDGWVLLSTGGTFSALHQAGLQVQSVSDLTHFPEILGGRVKTLHPKVHAGLLARDVDEHWSEMLSHGIGFIDMLVCNLYPFVEKSQDPNLSYLEVIENIDIGGVAMIRAAAKNHERVVVLCDPKDYEYYDEIGLKGEECDLMERKKLALKAFRHTAEYDRAIATYLENEIGGEGEVDSLPVNWTCSMKEHECLRYGENPHQKAVWYTDPKLEVPWKQLGGKKLSYNNLLDVDTALNVLQDFEEKVAVVIKHVTPCGLSVSENGELALEKAIGADRVSAFGSVIGVNFLLTLGCVEKISSLFVEALVVPEVQEEAEVWLKKKKPNCRLLLYKKTVEKNAVRSIRGGWLVQTPDCFVSERESWKVVTERVPSEEEWKELEFAWKVVKHVKSNAIVFTSERTTIGIGCGQPNRVLSVKLASQAMPKEWSEQSVKVCASDAFFPFSDSIEYASKSGIKAIIQPGGSIRDEESIRAANELGMTMVFTNERHFRH